MAEAKLPTYTVVFDADEFWMPLAATLTKARAESIVAEVIDGLVAEARKRWQKEWEDDPEGVRPFDEEAVRSEASERVHLSRWDIPFIGAEDPLDPHTMELAIEYEEDHFDSELFRP